MPSGTAITIGTFDGVHRGHAALLAAARDAAGPDGLVIALAFEPSPFTALRPDVAPASLSTAGQREGWLRSAGADEVHFVEPTADLLSQKPEAFLERLCDRFRPTHVVEGPDFRFGHRRAGDLQVLRALESRLGYRTIVVDEVLAPLTDCTLVKVRSSLIRWLVAHGRVRDAARLLGRPYEVIGPVVRGDHRGGSDLGVATANLDPGRFVLPGDGVFYGAATGPDGRDYPAAVSVGTKPTFGENPRVCEAHLIGFTPTADEYGWTLRLTIRDWLRDQIAYDSVERLVEQIHRDIARVKHMHLGTERAEPSHA